jgi:hypothetical protein
MGWFTWRDVNCEKVLALCSEGKQLPFGVTCDEWQRACAAISDSEVVPLKITDYQKTGIAFECDSSSQAWFPGGEAEFVKFLNVHFQFPDSIKGKHVDARTSIEMSIDTTGRLKELSFGEPKLLGYYEEEYRRVFAMMPSWSIAYCDKRKVKWRGIYLLQFSNADLQGREIKITASRH